MQSSKNQLQELFQKRQLPLPVYNTIRLPDYPDHTPMWKSTLTIYDQDHIGTGLSKKEAESTAANIALQIINNDQNLFKENSPILFKQKCNFEEIEFPTEMNTIVLVDGENYNFKLFFPGKFQTYEEAPLASEIYLIFVARNTTKNIVFELQDKYKNVYVFISQMVGKDAADYMLTFYAGKLTMDTRITQDVNFYLLTKDHYGAYVETLMPDCEWIPEDF